jgi:hypothetical protein
MKKIIYIIFGILFLSQQTICAQGPELTNIVVTRNRDNLLLYLNATGVFIEKTKKAILSGAPTSFAFYINLNRNRNYWLNKTIIDQKVTHTIKYDNLKKEFHIVRSWDSRGPVVVSSFEEARQLMITIDGLIITSLQELEKDKLYQK